MLQLIHVSKKYKHNVIFDDVNLKLPRKGLIFLKGKSGVGKSTLLNILYGIEGCKGTVKRKCSIGYMTQEGILNEDVSVICNLISFGECDDFLEMFDLCESKYKKVKYLSLGERKRVEFISTIMKKRDVYLLDEPFANLDHLNKYKILKYLKMLSNDSLIIVATHELLDECNNSIEIKNKKIIYNSSAKENWNNTLHGKSYFFSLIKMNKRRLIVRNLLGVIVLISCIFVGKLIKETSYEEVQGLDVYVYEENGMYYTPTEEQIKDYVNDNSYVRYFVEPSIVNKMKLYAKGREIDDYDVVLANDENVYVNDVFDALYGNNVLYVLIDGNVFEESVDKVVSDMYIRPTIYLPCNSYINYGDESFGVVIKDEINNIDKLTKLNVYPSVDEKFSRSVNKMNRYSRLSVMIGLFSLWVIVVILLFEHNIKIYRIIRFNVSDDFFVLYMILERVLMLIVSLCISIWWTCLILCEFMVSYLHLTKKMKGLKKI